MLYLRQVIVPWHPPRERKEFIRGNLNQTVIVDYRGGIDVTDRGWDLYEADTHTHGRSWASWKIVKLYKGGGGIRGESNKDVEIWCWFNDYELPMFQAGVPGDLRDSKIAGIYVSVRTDFIMDDLGAALCSPQEHLVSYDCLPRWNVEPAATKKKGIFGGLSERMLRELIAVLAFVECGRLILHSVRRFHWKETHKTVDLYRGIGQYHLRMCFCFCAVCYS